MLGTQRKKQWARETERGDQVCLGYGSRGQWEVFIQTGQINKPKSSAEGEIGVMDKCELRYRGVSGLGVQGDRASLGAGEFPRARRGLGRRQPAVRQREWSGQVPGGPIGENTQIGQHGAKWAGALGPGRLNKAGARGAWLLTTRSSCRQWRGLWIPAVARPRGGGGTVSQGRREGREKREGGGAQQRLFGPQLAPLR